MWVAAVPASAASSRCQPEGTSVLGPGLSPGPLHLLCVSDQSDPSYSVSIRPSNVVSVSRRSGWTDFSLRFHSSTSAKFQARPYMWAWHIGPEARASGEAEHITGTTSWRYILSVQIPRISVYAKICHTPPPASEGRSPANLWHDDDDNEVVQTEIQHARFGQAPSSSGSTTERAF